MSENKINVQSANHKLHVAKEDKKDEFYTSLDVIESELYHYRDLFKDKIVLCNCDDPFESNFFKYFALNFNHLGLKKLICTSYDGSPVAYTQLDLFDTANEDETKNKVAYKIEINEVLDYNSDGATDLSDVEWLLKNKKNSLSLLKEHGDFRSNECIEILKKADIVVTNPPFSLFREYMSQLIKYDKKFLIIGNQNAITYKEFFPLLAQNKVWIGCSIHSGDREFMVPDSYETRSKSLRIDENGHKYLRVPGVRWFTNLDYKERHEKLLLYKKYSPELYPKYDNYNAINVDKTSDIPFDYDGVMGVPITFLDKYCPEQFEIVAFRKGEDGKDLVYSFENGIEREREYNHTSEYSSSNERAGSNQECGRKNWREDNLCENHNKKEIIINIREIKEPDKFWKEENLLVPGDAMLINNKRKYARVLIRRKQNENHFI